MKRFHFSLEGLARLRDHKLELAQEALRVAEAKRLAAETALQKARNALDTGLRAQAELRCQEQIQPGFMNGAFSYLTELRREIVATEKAYALTVEAKAFAHREMLKCLQDAKVIERLREKALEAYATEQLREEERESADVHAASLIRVGRSLS